MSSSRLDKQGSGGNGNSATLSGKLGSRLCDDTELELLEEQMAVSTVSPRRNRGRRGSHFYMSTFPRRRRPQKSLMTLWSNLLEDFQGEQMRRTLSNITHWDFNAFAFDRVTSGRNLCILCTHLCHELGLIHHFKLDILALWKFFYLVEQGYHKYNPYHNGVHSCDVTQAMHCFLQEKAFNKCTPLELLAAIVAAATHDLDHPGRNEKFLMEAGTGMNHLGGVLYGSASSVLENHHWRSAVALLWESGLAKSFSVAQLDSLKEIVRQLILATDIARQQEFLSELSEHIDNDDFDLESRAEHRVFALQIAIKCADISNPCRSWNISRIWSYRACEEFFRQGDKERELGMNVTPFCDRFNMSVAKVQAGFYRMVAFPLFEEWNRFLSSNLSISLVHNLTSNQARWDLIVQQEARNSSIMIDSTTSSSSSTGPGSVAGDFRRVSLDPSSSYLRPRQHHRHCTSSCSMDPEDESDPCSSYPYLPLDVDSKLVDLNCAPAETFNRRHSLPISGRHFDISRNSSEDSADEVSAPATVGPGSHHFQRQGQSRGLSRFSRQSDLAICGHRLYCKRRLYASSRSTIQTVESESDSSFESDPEASAAHHQHRAVKIKVSEMHQESEEDKENNQQRLFIRTNSRRRGSAPSCLPTAVPLDSNAREHSPNDTFRHQQYVLSSHCGGGGGSRRGSLPNDLDNCQRVSRGSQSYRKRRIRLQSEEVHGRSKPSVFHSPGKRSQSSKCGSFDRRRGSAPNSTFRENKSPVPDSSLPTFQIGPHDNVHTDVEQLKRRMDAMSRGGNWNYKPIGQNVLRRNASLLEQGEVAASALLLLAGIGRRGSLPTKLGSSR